MAKYRSPVLEEFGWQNPVLDKDLTAPPSAPTKGDRYIVGGGATGDWSSHDKDIAWWDGSVWQFDTPEEGWMIHVDDENAFYKYTGSAWSEFTGTLNLANYVDEFTIKYENDKLKLHDRIEQNILLNAFRIAINGALVKDNMIDGIIDEFEDESGVDTPASTNENYNSSDDYYSPSITSNLELDYMEYASDEAAQTAYVSSDDVSTEAIEANYEGSADSGQEIAGDGGNNEEVAQEFTLPYGITCAKIQVYIDKFNSPSDNIECRIETDNSNVPSGTLVDANATKSIAASSISGTAGWVEFAFDSSFDLSASTAYHIVLKRSGSRDVNNYIRWYWDNSSPTYPNGQAERLNSSTWENRPNNDMLFRVYGTHIILQVYSEDIIKQQGSYALKVYAKETDSLNETLENDGLSIDLSGYAELKFDVYASRTGTNIQLQIYDSGGTTSTKDIVISSANTWTEISWDISGIADANKDNITKIIIKIINADSANTFYIDNFYAVGEANDMTLISESTTAESEPDNVKIVIFEQDVDSVIVNTDLKAYVSIDGGSNWDQVTLSDEGNYSTNKQILSGLVDVSARTGTSMEWKLVTDNKKNMKIHGVGLLWG